MNRENSENFRSGREIGQGAWSCWLGVVTYTTNIARGWSLGSGGLDGRIHGLMCLALLSTSDMEYRPHVHTPSLHVAPSSLPLQHQPVGFTYSSRLRTCTMDSKFPSSSSPVSKLHPSPNPEFKTNSTPQPVPTTRLKQICTDVCYQATRRIFRIHEATGSWKLTESQACFAALEKVDVYEHSRTESWNTSIIVITLRRYTVDTRIPVLKYIRPW